MYVHRYICTCVCNRVRCDVADVTSSVMSMGGSVLIFGCTLASFGHGLLSATIILCAYETSWHVFSV